MEDPLVTSLIVTGIGMLTLFVAMALLYGLMVGMTALIRDRGAHQAPHRGPTGEPGVEDEERMKVAAIAVALARAELEGGPQGPPRASPWRQLHHQRSLKHPRDRGTG